MCLSCEDVLKAPLEHKSYWSIETGPVTREDFNEYKAWSEGKIRVANALALQSASTLWKQTRELAKERNSREETENMLIIQRTTQSGTVDLWRREDRGALRKPSYTDPDNTEEREVERGQFLYKNRFWRMKELRVTTLLVRAQVAVENEEPSRALDCLYEAQELATRFEFPALEARCEFWRGRAEFGVGSYGTAVAAFQKALPCEGVYREGLEVRDWIRRARRGLGDQPEPRTRTEYMRQRSLRRRPRPDSFIGGAEHPPSFDLDDGSDDDENDTRACLPDFGRGDDSNAGENPRLGRRPRSSSEEESVNENDNMRGHLSMFGLNDNSNTGENFNAGGQQSRVSLDEESDNEGDNMGEHSPGSDLGDESNAGENPDTGGPRPRFPINDDSDNEDDKDTGEHSPKLGLGDKLDAGKESNPGEPRPRFALDDDSDNEDDDTKEQSPTFGTGDEPDTSKVLTKVGPRRRFNLDDEFEEGEDANRAAEDRRDKEIIEEAMGSLEFASQATIGGRAGGGLTLSEMRLGSLSSTEDEGTTVAVDKGKGRAIEDDFLDEDG